MSNNSEFTPRSNNEEVPTADALWEEFDRLGKNGGQPRGVTIYLSSGLSEENNTPYEDVVNPKDYYHLLMGSLLLKIMLHQASDSKITEGVVFLDNESETLDTAHYLPDVFDNFIDHVGGLLSARGQKENIAKQKDLVRRQSDTMKHEPAERIAVQTAYHLGMSSVHMRKIMNEEPALAGIIAVKDDQPTFVDFTKEGLLDIMDNLVSHANTILIGLGGQKDALGIHSQVVKEHRRLNGFES